MSIKVMSLVWDNFKRGGSDKLAMLALADWCNDEGGSLYPSIHKISKKINVKEAQARKIIHRLIDEGYLSVIANHNGGNPGQSRHYRMNIKMLSTTTPEYTPTQEYTPVLEERYPCTGGALPLHPSIANPSLSVNDPSLGDDPAPKNNPKKDETPRRRKTDLKEFPDPFLITDEMFEFAAQKGFSDDATIELTREFKDYHLSKGTKFIDWNRAWNNWIRKAVEFRKRGFK